MSWEVLVVVVPRVARSAQEAFSGLVMPKAAHERTATPDAALRAAGGFLDRLGCTADEQLGRAVAVKPSLGHVRWFLWRGQTWTVDARGKLGGRP